jgi:hypothetical protein
MIFSQKRQLGVSKGVYALFTTKSHQLLYRRDAPLPFDDPLPPWRGAR